MSETHLLVLLFSQSDSIINPFSSVFFVICLFCLYPVTSYLLAPCYQLSLICSFLYRLLFGFFLVNILICAAFLLVLLLCLVNPPSPLIHNGKPNGKDIIIDRQGPNISMSSHQEIGWPQKLQKLTINWLSFRYENLPIGTIVMTRKCVATWLYANN